MKNMTVLRAAQCCGGKLCGEDINEYAELGSVVIDSRCVQPGDLFVAYKGERADGHDYISTALDKGAARLRGAGLRCRCIRGRRRPQ